MPHNALHRMIGQQADVLDRIAGLDLATPAATLTAARRVILTGTGTSQHAAELGTLLLQQAGLDARWYPASTWARWSPGPQPGDALIVITHTGETAYAISARATALAAGVPVLSITGTHVDWPEAIHTVPKEEAETYTVSYTAAVAVLARLAGQAGAADGSPEALRRAAAQVGDVLADPGIDAVPVPARSLAIVGCGPWGITAREGALKLREGARMLAEGFDTEMFLHGNAVPLTAADGVLLLEPGADPDGLTGAVGAAAAAEGIPVATLSAPAGGLSPALAQFPMTVRVQLLAGRFAALRGSDPDTVITGRWADPQMWQLGSNS
jgi:glucosamine--fructose-6-phosphate aminotransferase (isomerizing)